MDSENSSSVVNVSTPVRSAKGMFLGRFKSSEKKAQTPKLAQPSFTEETIDAIGESVISEVKHVDARDEARDELDLVDDVIPEEGEEESADATEESVEGDLEAELAMKAKSEAHKLQMAMDQIEHLQLTNMTLQRTLEMAIKQSAREIALKDEEISEQRKRAQKAEDEKDCLKMDFAKQKLKSEGDFRSKINQLQSQIQQTKTMQASTGMASGKSFSARFFMSGKSQKLQAKVQANATERDYARKIKNLEEQVAKLKEDNARLTEDQQMSTDFCAHQTSKILELKDEVDGLRTRLGLYREKIRKDKTKMKQLKININDLEGKAGWVAEQVRRLTEDLDYERQKHVKPSRMAIVKQTEELHKLRGEVEELRKNTPLKDAAATPASAMKASAKKSAQKSAQKVTMAEPEEEEEAVAPAVRAPAVPGGAYGEGTLAELLTRAKKAREQKGVDTEKLVERNRESKKRREAAAAAAGNGQADALIRKAMGNRRVHLNDDDENSLMSSSDEGSDFD